jgi:hypothetical protein
MAGGNNDIAGRAEMLHHKTGGRRGCDADINRYTDSQPDTSESRNCEVLPGFGGVASNNNSAALA